VQRPVQRLSFTCRYFFDRRGERTPAKKQLEGIINFSGVTAVFSGKKQGFYRSNKRQQNTPPHSA
jgi:hypothetical protein